MRLHYVGHASVLLHVAGVCVLTDPWLTPYLDRFWEHYPAADPPFVQSDVDLILLSHHHYDHFHLPSLAQLNRGAVVLFPETTGTRAATAPGAGAFAVPWLLRRLGFTRIKGLKPFQLLKVGDLTITCFPSDVNFPELSFLISNGEASVFLAGDSLLHSSTERWFQSSHTRPDIAIVPVHSTATDACFRNRHERDDVCSRKSEAIASFHKYLRLFGQSVIIPGSFGWRVRSQPAPDEESCAWMNHRIFPLTVVDGIRLAEDAGLEVHCWGPGDNVELNTGMHADGPFWDRRDRYADICAEYTLADPDMAMPEFEPRKFGPPIAREERDRIVAFVEHDLIPGIADTPFYMQAIEHGLRTRVRVDEELCWIVDFSAIDRPVIRSESDRFDDSIWIAGRTIARLIESDILYGHTWGCWVGGSPILDAVFSHPSRYIRYAERLLSTPTAIAKYGQ